VPTHQARGKSVRRADVSSFDPMNSGSSAKTRKMAGTGDPNGRSQDLDGRNDHPTNVEPKMPVRRGGARQSRPEPSGRRGGAAREAPGAYPRASPDARTAKPSRPLGGQRRASELLEFLAKKLVAKTDDVKVELFLDEEQQTRHRNWSWTRKTIGKRDRLAADALLRRCARSCGPTAGRSRERDILNTKKRRIG